MEKFFNGENFTHEEFMKGVTSALLEGTAVPLIAGSSETGAGLDILLETICSYMPSPNDERAHNGFRREDGEQASVDPNEPFSAVVFKTIVDPFVGKISIFKVVSGKLKKDDTLYNSSKGISEKFGSLFFLRGKNQIETDEIVAGDIGAVSKLVETETSDTLTTAKNNIVYKRIKLPKPTLTYAIKPVSKNDDDKIGPALQKYLKDQVLCPQEIQKQNS